jgi:CheY-like chemotaxis protein
MAGLGFGATDHPQGSLLRKSQILHRWQPVSFGESGCVLVVDQDRCVADTLAQPIRSLRLDIVSAPDGKEALVAAHHAPVLLLLVELQLPDIPGLEVIRRLRAEGIEAPFIVISGHATVPVTVEAMALGALTVLEKPFRPDVLCAAVACAIGSTTVHHDSKSVPHVTTDTIGGAHGPHPAEPCTPAERWRDFVMGLIMSEQDLKTNGVWAKHLGVSLSVLREACRLVHVAPHDARDFARMLRAVCHSGRHWKPETLLNFADARTLIKLETRSGLKGRRETAPPTLEEFFERQQWIQPDNPGLLAVRAAMIGRAR